MIFFDKTIKISEQSFMVFVNSVTNSSIQIPVDEKTKSLFLHYFDRLSPSLKIVEETENKAIENNVIDNKIIKGKS